MTTTKKLDNGTQTDFGVEPNNSDADNYTLCSDGWYWAVIDVFADISDSGNVKGWSDEDQFVFDGTCVELDKIISEL